MSTTLLRVAIKSTRVRHYRTAFHTIVYSMLYAQQALTVNVTVLYDVIVINK